VLGFEPMTYGSESECVTHYITAFRCMIAAPGMPLDDRNRRSVSHEHTDADIVRGTQ